MFRLIALTFYGKPRYDEKTIHPHESPKVMIIPLIILAVLAVIGGFIGFPHYLGLPNLLDEWLEPVFKNANNLLAVSKPATEHSIGIEILLVFVSVAIAVSAIIFSFRKYSQQEKFKTAKGFGKLVENKYYVDEAYDLVVVNPVQKTSDKFLWKIFDMKIIDGAVNGIAVYLSKLSFDWRKLQTGIVQDYATLTIAGIILIILYMVFM
jgi:NADH-quinone oxidoreductase subunit L